MRHTTPCVSIPRDNFFHACLHLRAIISVLKEELEKNEFADDDEDICAINADALLVEVNTVLALLIDTFPEEDNRALARHLLETLRIEFEDGLVFEVMTGVCTTDKRVLRVPTTVCHEACEHLLTSEIIDDLSAVIHTLKKCQMTLEGWIGKSQVRVRAYKRFQKSPPTIEIDILGTSGEGVSRTFPQ